MDVHAELAQNGVASAHHTPARGNCTIRSSKNDPLGTTPQIIKELRQHHGNLWENCETTKFLQCLECLITLPLQPSRHLLHYAFGSFEVNLAAPPLKVPVLALASGENTKPEVRLELMGSPGVSVQKARRKSWIDRSRRNIKEQLDIEMSMTLNPLVAINGTHMYYILLYIYHYFICLLMFFPCFPCFYFFWLSATLEARFIRWLPNFWSAVRRPMVPLLGALAPHTLYHFCPSMPDPIPMQSTWQIYWWRVVPISTSNARRVFSFTLVKYGEVNM